LFGSFSASLRQRLPVRSDVLQVFSIVLFAVFGWSIRGFLYKIPAFTLYFGLSSNLAIFCYMLGFALLESALVMGILLALSVLLPSGFLREGFAYKSFLLILVGTIAAVVFEGWYRINFFKDIMAGNDYAIPPFVVGVVATIVLLFALLWVFRLWPPLQQYARAVMEQFSIFTYIYVPLGLIGLLVVLLRNL
jgi:hypothetical protein